ncbi:MAG: ATP-binding protein [Archangium sp.]|nr:ATP-binding protein [Archangium sp.]
MRRLWLALVAVMLLGGALAAALSVLTTLVQRDRAALVEQFTRDRQLQLERAASAVSRGLDDVAEDVRFAGELLGQDRPLVERKAELEALLESIGKYKAITVFGPDARQLLTLSDRRLTTSLEPWLPALHETARLALQQAPGQVAVSPPLGEDASGWLRVFATAIDDPKGVKVGVVAVVVDAAPLMTALSSLGDEQGSRLLVLGAHGRPLPLADRLLSEAAKNLEALPRRPALEAVLGGMRAGRAGHVALGADEATALGLAPAEHIAIFMPLTVRGGTSWSVAALSSTEALRSHDRSLLARLVLVAGVLAGFFALLGISLTLTLRRANELSETRRHATELAHARDVIQKVLDHVPTGILALSRDLKVTSVNRALRQRLQPFAAGATLRRVFAGAPPFQLERLVELVHSSRAGLQVTTVVTESLFGDRGHFSLSSVPLAQPDEELASLLLVDDLSRVRTLEEQLLRSEKLSTVGVLAAGIAHEIGTPLGIARGRAEYLAGKLDDETPQRAGLLSIVEQIDRVSRIIRQLLDFSRTQPAATTQVSLAEAFEAVGRLLGLEAERRGLRLEIRPPGVVVVAADADQLQQVLINLLLNSLDASSAGQMVELLAEPGRGVVELVVRDQGDGMNEDAQRRIFDPFWTTKKRGQGTGLGLSVVAQVVRNHGGSISVTSQPQRGTTVRIAWPLYNPEAERAANEAKSPSAGGR